MDINLIKETMSKNSGDNVWFWGGLVFVVLLLLCTWIIVFFIDYRSCANVICTSNVTGPDGEDGDPGPSAGAANQGPFGPLSIVTGKQGPAGASKKGPKGAPSAGGLITGPKGEKGPTGDPPHTHDGIFFEDVGLTSLSTADGLIGSNILLNYYEEFVTKCPLNFMTNGTEFPVATLTFVRFGRHVTMGCVVGDIRPPSLFNNQLKGDIGSVQPNYIQFSTSMLNNVSRFFNVSNKPWQYKTVVQVQFSSEATAAPENFAIRIYRPAQLLIRTQTAQILMQLFADPNQDRFCTLHFPGESAIFWGLYGIPFSFYANWNLLL